MAKIKPLGDKVLVERVESQAKTAGGIVLPDNAKEKPTEGRVVAVGTGRVTDEGQRLPLSVKTGDRVLFGSFAGTAVKEMGKEYLILEEGDLLGVVDEAPWSSGRGSARSGEPRGGKQESKAGDSKGGKSGAARKK